MAADNFGGQNNVNTTADIVRPLRHAMMQRRYWTVGIGSLSLCLAVCTLSLLVSSADGRIDAAERTLNSCNCNS